MTARAPIIAGRSVIVVSVQDSVDKALTRIGSKLNKFSAGANKLGFELFSGGLVGTLGIGVLTKQFSTFEDNILFLSTKLQGTQKELEAVENRIRSLGRTTSFTAKEVSDGAVVLAQAGFKAQEVIKLLQPTLDLARGARIELGASGEILSNTLRSFSLDASNAANVASQFIAASRSGTLNVIDLKESIKEVLGTVRTLNIDLPTTLALITQLAERSLKGTKAGTSLNTALLNLASKQKQLKDTLGISLPENLDGDSFINFLDQLYNRIQNLGNTRRVSILQQLFNIRGGRAITGLDDIKRIIELQKEIRNAGNEAREAAIKMDSGFGGSVRRATSALESLGITAGRIFGEMVTPILEAVPAIANMTEGLVASNPLIVASLLAIPPAALAAGAGLLGLSFIGGKLATVVLGLAGSFRYFGGIVGKGINKQLATVAITLNSIKKAGKGADKGLSKLLLTPIVATRGRNAGKPKASSFVKRTAQAIGAIKIPFAAGLEKSLKFIGTKAERGILKTAIAVNRLSRSLIAFRGIPAILLSTATAFVGLGTSLASMRIGTIVLSLHTLSRRLKDFKSFLPQIKAKGFKGLRLELLKIRLAVQGLLTSLPLLGSVIKKTVTTNTFKGFIAFRNIFTNIRRGFARGNLGKVISPVPILRFFAAFKRVFVVRTAGNVLLKFWKIVKTIDFVGIFYRSFITVGKLAKSFFLLANGIRRFVFSASGILLLLEGLIIFGPKIPIINAAFTRMGKGISAAFSQIFSIFRELDGPFKLFVDGFKDLIAGRTVGVDSITNSFVAAITVIKGNFVAAWNEIKNAFAPAFDFIYKSIQSVAATFVLIKDSLLPGVTAGVGSIISAFSIDKAGSGISGFIKEAINSIDMRSFFGFIGNIVSMMSITITSIIQTMVVSVLETMRDIRMGLAQVLASISGPVFGDMTKAIKAIVGDPGHGGMSVINPDGSISERKAKDATGAFALEKTLVNTNKIFSEIPVRINGALNTFSAKLDKIFSINTARDAKNQSVAAQDAAFGARIDAAAAARKAEAARNRASRNGLPLPGEDAAAGRILGAINAAAAAKPPSKLQLLTRQRDNLVNNIQGNIAGLNNIAENALNGVDSIEDLLESVDLQVENQKLQKDLVGVRKEIRAEEKAQRLAALKDQFQSKGADLSRIVAATVGSFNATRRNLLKVNPGLTTEDKQLVKLDDIATNTNDSKDLLQEIVKQDGGAFK
jgi:TP901 family phage tail tape measure protein